MSITKRL